MWKRTFALALLLFLLLVGTAQGHAVLDHAQPGANSVLATAPAEIRLWMTEPVEPKYSAIHVYDATGAAVPISASTVDADDPKQMYVAPGPLAEGLYTVVWVAVSATDGHRANGSFPFTIGAHQAPPPTAATPVEPKLPFAEMAIRWFNFLALVWGVGSIAFAVLVWRPAALGSHPAAVQRLEYVIWLGWIAMGLATVLILLLETAVATGDGVKALTDIAALGDVVWHTRFGTLWLARGALWLVIGLLLALAARANWALWAALVAGVALLALTSLFSHAGAATSSTAAIVADWVHLTMTAVWLGGLVQLIAILPVLVRMQTPALSIDRLVARFSNLARVAVAAIVITGFYAAWLQVGSVEALFTTLYGRLLLVKLVLIVPLAGVAAFNLVVTQRRLAAGGEIWTHRLRWLVGIELALASLILVAVAGMTAINPAHNELAQRQQAAAALASAVAPTASVPTPMPITDMQMVDDLHIMFTVAPGWVGENEFIVDLSTVEGAPITDATMIRLRFQPENKAIGQSELRITPATNPDQQQGGVYHIKGSNLSTPGAWKVRLTIERPDQYDTVVDFAPSVTAPPAVDPAPTVEPRP